MRKHLLEMPDKETDHPNVDETKEDEFLQKVKAVIETQLNSPDLSIDTLAKEMNISSRQLFRKIKATANTTPNDFIRNIRMEKAIDLLYKKEMNISEIADLESCCRKAVEPDSSEGLQEKEETMKEDR